MKNVLLDALDTVLDRLRGGGPIIACVPPGIHKRWSPSRSRWIQFNREDELIVRQSIYALTEAEARWDDNTWVLGPPTRGLRPE